VGSAESGEDSIYNDYVQAYNKKNIFSILFFEEKIISNFFSLLLEQGEKKSKKLFFSLGFLQGETIVFEPFK